MSEEVYFSTDVETDGPIPGPHSMLSFGSAAYTADGTLLGKLLVPETVSNLTWGGPKRNRLFITATTSVYSLLTTANGAPEAYGPRV